MRSIQRTPDRALFRDLVAIGAAMIAVGASFGAIAVAAGLPTWVPIAMSLIVFAGGAQFMAVGLLAAGNPLAAVLAGLLLNARHLPFGLAVADAVGDRPLSRAVGSHLMTDEVVAFTLAQADPARRRRVYWLTGLVLFGSWNTGTVLGVWLGGAAGDPASLGLDAAFPAGLLALLLPALREPETRRVALVGAAVAVLAAPLLPAGLPVLLALTGLLAAWAPVGRRRGRPEPTPNRARAGSAPVDRGEPGSAGDPPTATVPITAPDQRTGSRRRP